MITTDAQSRSAWLARGMSGLCQVVSQSELSGARRCAAVLFLDRLPQAVSRPHHVRLVREALHTLLSADRAQLFEIPHGRIAVIWRGNREAEFDGVRRRLDHLLSGQSDMSAQGCAPLLSRYDLPDQAERLLDDLVHHAVRDTACDLLALDLKLLADVETTLAQADLARFARVRPIVGLREADGAAGTFPLAWEERYFAVNDLASSLAPGRNFQAEACLFGRLTRTLDRRMLSLLTTPGELTRCGPFAININVATILSSAFLGFDNVLPNHLRGEIILTLRATDILADSQDFVFARNFARTRSYRLALADVTPAQIALLDVATAGIDLMNIKLTPRLRDADPAWRRLVPPGTGLVLTDINRPSELRWAVAHEFRLGRGALFSP